MSNNHTCVHSTYLAYAGSFGQLTKNIKQHKTTSFYLLFHWKHLSWLILLVCDRMEWIMIYHQNEQDKQKKTSSATQMHRSSTESPNSSYGSYGMLLISEDCNDFLLMLVIICCYFLMVCHHYWFSIAAVLRLSLYRFCWCALNFVIF